MSAPGPLTGSRIRDLRQDRGLRQAALAAAVGISASYLNLIEHNRRKIGGKLLHDIARALGTDPLALGDGAEAPTLFQLRAAAAADPTAGSELTRIGDFAGRFPGWAALAVHQARRIALLETRVAGLADRLGHDAQLARTLDEVVGAVTAIHSTASILVDEPDLDRDWRTRFHRNIHNDSVRLADTSQRLVRYLAAPGEAGEAALSPPEQVEWALDGMEQPIALLEGGQGDPAGLAAGIAGLSGAARVLMVRWLTRYQADALALPMGVLAPAALSEGHDPLRLAARFGIGLAQVMRRLAVLPRGQGHPVLGLAIVDGAGAVTFQRGAGLFSLPRGGDGCPLWPVHQAMGQPGRPLRAVVRMPGAPGAQFLCHAVAEPLVWPGYDLPPVLEATMLVQPDPPPEAGPARAVGPGCRLCPQPDCPARREPSILALDALPL